MHRELKSETSAKERLTMLLNSSDSEATAESLTDQSYCGSDPFKTDFEELTHLSNKKHSF